MTRSLQGALWVAGTVFVAAASAYVTVKLTAAANPPAILPPPSPESSRPVDSEESLHAWMHQNLEISAEEHDLLLPYEQAFERDRLRLRAEIRQAGQQLAASIRANADQKTLDEELNRLNGLNAELRKATLDHFLVMKEHLNPVQAEKLLQWTHDSIVGTASP